MQALPPLWPGNVDAWRVYSVSSTQWRSSGFGVTGLDYLALDWAAKRIGVDVTEAVFAKIRMLERAVLERQAEQATRDSQAE